MLLPNQYPPVQRSRKRAGFTSGTNGLLPSERRQRFRCTSRGDDHIARLQFQMKGDDAWCDLPYECEKRSS
jgi:hypothetical protein